MANKCHQNSLRSNGTPMNGRVDANGADCLEGWNGAHKAVNGVNGMNGDKVPYSLVNCGMTP